MHENAQLIQKFYSCFQAREAAGMSACYHPEAIFSDPVFGRLEGQQVAAMWQMLCSRAQDLEINFNDIHANAEAGTAHWEALYTFSKTGRPVHNVIDAAFTFREGRILRHIDTFNLWKWTRMALGPAGLFLGWTPILQTAIRKDARRSLEAFVEKHSALHR
ncbi:MAG: nuclear transport factor 2 family protein [bacterium]